MTGRSNASPVRPSCSVTWPRARQARELEHALDLLLGRAVEHRRRERHAACQVARRAATISSSSKRLEVLRLAASSCRSASSNLRTSAAFACAFSMSSILRPRPFAAQPRCDFEDLADVHPRRHAERIQHDVDRRAVRHVRHVLDRHDLRHDALVAVTAGHLVARLQAALDRDVHLDHLLHARRQLVALRQLLLLLLEHLVELDAHLRERLLHLLELARRVLGREADVEPVVALDARPDTPW